MAYRTENFDACLEIIKRLPPNTWWSIEKPGCVQVQATGEAVGAIRGALGGIWAKRLENSIGWWEYTAIIDNVLVTIYADKVGPKGCKRVETIIKERVWIEPSEGHFKDTECKAVTWNCPEGIEEAPEPAAVREHCSQALPQSTEVATMNPSADERIDKLIEDRLAPGDPLEEVVEVVAHHLQAALVQAYADGQREHGINGVGR